MRDVLISLLKPIYLLIRSRPEVASIMATIELALARFLTEALQLLPEILLTLNAFITLVISLIALREKLRKRRPADGDAQSTD